MVAHPAFRVAVDRVDDGEWTGGFRRDAGLLQQFAHRALRDGLAEFEDTTRKPPTAGQRGVGAAHDESALTAQYYRQDADDRALRVAAALFPDRDCGLSCHCELTTGRAADRPSMKPPPERFPGESG